MNRGVARGPEPPPPEFGRSVNPIQTRGADYVPHTTANHTQIKKAIYTSVNTSPKPNSNPNPHLSGER